MTTPSIAPVSVEIADPPEWYELRELIALELGVTPISGEALHRSVSTYVRTGHSHEMKPGRIIRSLFELVKAVPMSSIDQQRLNERIALWSIDAYFGPRGLRVSFTLPHENA